MKPSEAGRDVSRIEISALLDRRGAEAVALALRYRLRQLGYEGVSITVAPSAPNARPADAGGGSAASA